MRVEDNAKLSNLFLFLPFCNFGSRPSELEPWPSRLSTLRVPPLFSTIFRGDALDCTE